MEVLYLPCSILVWIKWTVVKNEAFRMVLTHAKYHLVHAAITNSAFTNPPDLQFG
jgi:hypothetical protein